MTRHIKTLGFSIAGIKAVARTRFKRGHSVVVTGELCGMPQQRVREIENTILRVVQILDDKTVAAAREMLAQKKEEVRK